MAPRQGGAILLSPDGIRLHEMLELRALARDQELGRSIVEAGALQLPDGGAEFKNLGAQF